MIIGGYGSDTITTGAGDAVILGDNGEVLEARPRRRRSSASRRPTVSSATGADDSITSGAGDNVILGGVGGDPITALGGSQNIILGDNGVVNLNNAGSNDIYSVACGDGTNACDRPGRWRRHDLGRRERHRDRRRRLRPDHARRRQQHRARRQRLRLEDRRQHRLRDARRRRSPSRRPTPRPRPAARTRSSRTAARM